MDTKAVESSQAVEAKANGQPEPEEDEVDFEQLGKTDFSLKLKEVPFTIEGKPHRLRQLDGGLRGEYHEQLFGEYMMRDGDNYITIKHKGLYAILLSRSVVGPDGKYVTMEEAERWPFPMQQQLWRAARKLSGLDKEAKKEAAKKS